MELIYMLVLHLECSFLPSFLSRVSKLPLHFPHVFTLTVILVLQVLAINLSIPSFPRKTLQAFHFPFLEPLPHIVSGNCPPSPCPNRLPSTLNDQKLSLIRAVKSKLHMSKLANNQRHPVSHQQSRVSNICAPTMVVIPASMSKSS